MKFIWPLKESVEAVEVSDSELLSLYHYPEPVRKPHVRVNLVCTASGAIAAEGRSAGVTSAGDRILFGRLRRLADVILMGAGTVRADDCRGARARADVRAFRRERGQADVPPVAVVTRSADLRPDCRLFTDTYVPPIILTTTTAPTSRVKSLRDAGADVEFVGDYHVDIRAVLDALSERGLNRVLCEGGPTLFGSLVAAQAVDELCLTVTPRLGGGGQLSMGAEVDVYAMTLISVMISDGALLLRYRR